jgi:hypothetical protein
MPDNKGLNRGGTGGQEGEIQPEGGQPEANIDRSMDLERKQQQNQQNNPTRQRDPQKQQGQRDPQKQQGGIGREPNLEDKQKIQPQHEVD